MEGGGEISARSKEGAWEEQRRRGTNPEKKRGKERAEHGGGDRRRKPRRGSAGPRTWETAPGTNRGYRHRHVGAAKDRGRAREQRREGVLSAPESKQSRSR